MSIVAVPAMLAPILGPTLGGLIVDNASWRWIFFVNLPIGVDRRSSPRCGCCRASSGRRPTASTSAASS